MRLYSKGQVFFFSAIAVLFSLTIFTAALYKLNYFAFQQNNSATSQDQIFDLKLNHQTTQTSFAQNSSSDDYTQDELQNISVYEQNQEAVVNITTEVMAINWFLEPISQEGGAGSGSIIDTRGYVVTNTHVVDKANKIFITLADGSQYEAKLIGTDTASDIAVLKFDPPRNIELKTITFGDSTSLRVGQKVIAIGNPFGFERTLTTGVVSSLGRPIQTSRNTIIRDMIQIDAAINPGNSGGPLFDSKGKMIGINTMIYSRTGTSAGIGFAVPVDTARRVVSELIQFGTVRRGVIDATFVQMTASIASYAKIPTRQGLLISETLKNGNAEKAGLRGGTEAVRYGSSRNSQIIYIGGDIITSINDIPIGSYADYYSALESKKPGDVIRVTIMRGNNQIEMNIALSATPN
ncbi:MAG: S1C family serine protease [Treponemataceae bacterium]